MSYDCATYPAFDAASTVAPPAYHIPSVYNLRACVAAPNALTAACCSGVNIGYGGTTNQCGWTVCVTDASDADFAACLAANGGEGASFNCADMVDDPEPEPPVSTDPATPVSTDLVPPVSTDPAPPISSTISPDPEPPVTPTPSTTESEPNPSIIPDDVSSEIPSSAAPSSSVETSSSVMPSSTSLWVGPSYTAAGAPPPAASVPTTVVVRTVTSSSASKSLASPTPIAESAATQRTTAGAFVVLGALAVLVSLQ